jgi:hypothetical protein
VKLEDLSDSVLQVGSLIVLDGADKKAVEDARILSESQNADSVTRSEIASGIQDPNLGLTTVPSTPTLSAYVDNGTFYLSWDKQAALALGAFVGYELQVSADGSNWYAPGNAGTWYSGSLGGALALMVENYAWTPPVTLDGDGLVAISSYRMRVRRAAKASYSAYSALGPTAQFTAPSTPSAPTVSAYPLRVAVVIAPVTGAVRYGVKRSVDSGSNWSAILLSNTHSYDDVIAYLEKATLDAYRYKVVAIDKNNVPSAWSAATGAAPNYDNYGTWTPAVPVPTTKGAGRQITVSWLAQATPLLGFVGYEVQISLDNNTWYAPNVSDDPFASVDNWRTGSSGTTGKVVSGVQFTMVVPLSGQDTDNPVSTTYYFRVRTKGLKGASTNDSTYSTGASVAATATGVKDIIALAVTQAKIGNRAVNAAKVALSSLTSSVIAASAIISSKLAASAVSAVKIAAGAVTNAKIAVSAIDATKIQASAIIASKLAAGAVIDVKLATSAVTAAKIAAGAVTNAKLGASAVTASKLAQSAVTAVKIASRAIDATKIVLSSLTASVIAAGAITNVKIGTSAITAPKIAAGAIIAAKIAASAVAAAAIQAGAVIAGKIATSAVTAANIQAGAITAAKIAASSVAAASIQAGAITAAKMAVSSVTAVSIQAGAVIAAKIGASAVIAGKIKASAVTSATIATSAITAVKIAAGAITAVKMAASSVAAGSIQAGAITAAKMAASSVAAVAIQAGAITAVKIAASAVAANNIQAGAVIAAKIGASAVTAAAIAAGAIIAAKIAARAVTVDKLLVCDINNYVANGLFVYDTVGQAPVGWDNPSSRCTVQTTGATFAANCLKVTATGVLADIFENVTKVPIDAGVELMLQAWVKADAGTNGTITPLIVRFYNGQDAYLSEITIAAVSPNTSWAESTIKALAPANSAYFKVEVRVPAASNTGAWYVGDLRVFKRMGSSLIVDGSIIAGKIATSAVTASTIAANSVIAAKIATSAIIAAKIAASAVTSAKIQAGAIVAGKIAAGAVTATAIAASTIVAGKIATGTITADRLNMTNIFAQSIELNVNGKIWASSSAYGTAGGLFMGKESAVWKFSLSDKLLWDGSTLVVKGRIKTNVIDIDDVVVDIANWTAPSPNYAGTVIYAAIAANLPENYKWYPATGTFNSKTVEGVAKSATQLFVYLASAPTLVFTNDATVYTTQGNIDVGGAPRITTYTTIEPYQDDSLSIGGSRAFQYAKFNYIFLGTSSGAAAAIMPQVDAKTLTLGSATFRWNIVQPATDDYAALGGSSYRFTSFYVKGLTVTGGAITVKGHINFDASTYNIGDSTNRLNNLFITGSIDGTVKPASNDVNDIGASSYIYSNVYAKNLHATGSEGDRTAGSYRPDSTVSINNGTYTASYVKKFEWKAKKAGTYRTSITLTADDGGNTLYARVYKNGSAVGTERYRASSTPITYTEDIAFVVGDLIQLYMKWSNTISSTLVTFGLFFAEEGWLLSYGG